MALMRHPEIETIAMTRTPDDSPSAKGSAGINPVTESTNARLPRTVSELPRYINTLRTFIELLTFSLQAVVAELFN